MRLSQRPKLPLCCLRQALASLLQNDHPTRSLFVLAMDNGQDAVMKAVAERQGGID